MATYRGVELVRMMGLISVVIDGRYFYATSSKDARWLIQQLYRSEYDLKQLDEEVESPRILDMLNERDRQLYYERYGGNIPVMEDPFMSQFFEDLTPWLPKDRFDEEAKGTCLEQDFILDYGTTYNPKEPPDVIPTTITRHD